MHLERDPSVWKSMPLSASLKEISLGIIHNLASVSYINFWSLLVCAFILILNFRLKPAEKKTNIRNLTLLWKEEAIWCKFHLIWFILQLPPGGSSCLNSLFCWFFYTTNLLVLVKQKTKLEECSGWCEGETVLLLTECFRSDSWVCQIIFLCCWILPLISLDMSAVYLNQMQHYN